MTIQYQGVWSLQSAAQLQSTQRWVTDPLYKNTTLLLQADDAANGAQNNTFLDSSSNSFAITRNGGNPGMTQGSFTPFSLQPGAWSNFFNASTADWINSSSAASPSGTEDFTVECWYCPTSKAVNYPTIFSTNSTYSFSTAFQIYDRHDAFSGKFSVYGAGVNGMASTTSVVNGVWYHIAVTRQNVAGTYTLRLFVNGVLEASSTSASGSLSSNACYIGRADTTSLSLTYLNGQVSNFRIVRGGALYTSDFTPSTTPLTTTVRTGTVSLLTCQSNRFIDNSVNSYSITISGAPSVQAFSPFAPQYQWTSSVIGGSGYFDGTGDYLTYTTPSTVVREWWVNDFTVEAWIYPTTLTGWDYSDGGNRISTVIGNASPTATNNFWSFGPINTGAVRLYYFNGAGVLVTSTETVKVNQWNHIAFTKTSTGIRIFVNGVGTTATAVSGTPQSGNTFPLTVGQINNTACNGYISGVRILNGTAQYSGTTYTIPTAPPTAITNTSLLLNFTNAGIYDGTMKNNLETVGNAQISTAVVKYGSGSMYFDGNGDYLRSASNPVCALGSGDFTIEFWANIPSYSSNRILSWGTTSAPIIYFASGYLYYDIYGGANIAQSTIITPLNTWTHCAVVRLNGVTKLYINGVQGGSATDTNNWTGQSGFWVGTDAGTTFYTGYLDDLRITKGIARYTQNFIPPSVALPRQ